MQEKRKWKRAPVNREVMLNGAIKARMLDIGKGGMYIHTDRLFPIGHTLSVSFRLEEDKVEAKATVCHSRAGVGMGLTFVDLEPSALALIGRFVSSAEERDQGIAAKKNVLLVEDNALNRTINKSQLVHDGYNVFEAADGSQAISLLGKEKVDIVVLDLQLPVLDGFKVLALMKDTPAWKDIPVIVCSSRTSAEEMNRLKSAGAAEFLSKVTTRPAILAERIKAYLKR